MHSDDQSLPWILNMARTVSINHPDLPSTGVEKSIPNQNCARPARAALGYSVKSS